MIAKPVFPDCTITISEDPDSKDPQVEWDPNPVMAPVDKKGFAWQVINNTSKKLKVRIDWVRNKTNPGDKKQPWKQINLKDLEVEAPPHNPLIPDPTITVDMDGGTVKDVHKYSIHLKGHAIVDPELEIVPPDKQI